MCKSVRGAAFFGSSVHLALSFVFLFWFIFDTLISEININLWKCEPNELKFRDNDPLSHYLNVVFKLFYFIALFITGIYMFRGVERERPRMLKFATLGFVILQIVGIVLFSVFFSIQWNTEPQPQISMQPETARLVGEESLSSNVSININAVAIEVENIQETPVITSDPVDIAEIVNTVTPMISESVLPAPDINDTTTTPIPHIIHDVIQVTTTTASPSPTTTAPTIRDLSPCSSSDCSLSPKPTNVRQRLPHNQLVSLVLQMCFAIANGIGSVIYVIVLALYMLKL